MKKQRSGNRTGRYLAGLLVLVFAFFAACLPAAPSAYAAQSASDALDAAFAGDADFESDGADAVGNDTTEASWDDLTTSGTQTDVSEMQFIFDTSGVSEDDLAALNEQAAELYEEYGLGIYFAEERTESDQDTITRAQAFYEKNCPIKDGALLYLTTSESSNEYHVYLSGRAEHIFTEEETNQVWDVFTEGNTYYEEGIADYLTYMGDVMEAHGLQVIPSERLQPLLVDEADLLSDIEESLLLDQLTEASEKEQLDIAVVTVNTLDGKSPEAFADDYYDYNGYGQGENKDGVLLLISMEDRDWHVTTTGYGITAVNDAAIRLIEDRILSDLSGGYYYDAFSSYCNTVEEVTEMARNGSPYEGGYTSLNLSAKERVGASAVLGIIIGSLIGFGATAAQKRKLKSVHMQHGAAAYIYGDASHLDVREDRFIRRNVVRNKLPDNDDRGGGGGGGSTIHFGSSGTMHGGGGGKF